MKIDTIRERITRPPAEFGVIPFPFLNDQVEEECLCYALEEMTAKWISDPFVSFPRGGNPLRTKEYQETRDGNHSANS